MIRQGDIYWIDLGDPAGSGPGLRHPHVVVQNNVFNRSRINTAVVCALTSKLKRAGTPGNVLLDPGEGDLDEQSVVMVSQLFTVDKSELADYVGTLSRDRVAQILEGVRLVLEPRDVDE
jgi:mRNA interferase MazF